MPTYDQGPSGPPPRSSNSKSGSPPIDQGDMGPPSGPPTQIRQRPGNPPPDGSQKFERQPSQGSLGPAGTVELSQISADPVGVVVRRFFRQSVSAGFHTHVAVAQAWRPSTGNVASRTIAKRSVPSRTVVSRAPASRDFEEPRIVARTD